MQTCRHVTSPTNESKLCVWFPREKKKKNRLSNMSACGGGGAGLDVVEQRKCNEKPTLTRGFNKVPDLHFPDIHL
jgi:hypothetical protein